MWLRLDDTRRKETDTTVISEEPTPKSTNQNGNPAANDGQQPSTSAAAADADANTSSSAIKLIANSESDEIHNIEEYEIKTSGFLFYFIVNLNFYQYYLSDFQ